MKRYTTLITFIYLIGCNQKIKVTNVEIREKIYDLGTMKLGSPKSANFFLKNIGESNFKISEIEPDCHCTVPKWSKEEIVPNDSTKIEVVVDKNFEGIFQQIIKVRCNTKEGVILLIVRGKYEK